jgi:hypothetical protein
VYTNDATYMNDRYFVRDWRQKLVIRNLSYYYKLNFLQKYGAIQVRRGKKKHKETCRQSEQQKRRKKWRKEKKNTSLLAFCHYVSLLASSRNNYLLYHRKLRQTKLVDLRILKSNFVQKSVDTKQTVWKIWRNKFKFQNTQNKLLIEHIYLSLGICLILKNQISRHDICFIYIMLWKIIIFYLCFVFYVLVSNKWTIL